MTENLYHNEATVKESGFSFDNCARNLTMESMGYKAPKATSTGTTTVACVYKDGVVMGADSRATSGDIIADKYCVKVHPITDNIAACGAGTAADLDQVGRMLRAHCTLMELNTGRKAPVIAALRKAKQHLFRYMGYVGAYLLIGGVDFQGPHLYTVHAHGSSSQLPYVSDGSGSLNAGTVLELGFKMGMTEEEATGLVRRALEAGMHGDNKSGNTLRLVVITKEGSKEVGPFTPDFAQKLQVDLDYRMKPGTTKVLKQKEIKYDVVSSMDID